MWHQLLWGVGVGFPTSILITPIPDCALCCSQGNPVFLEQVTLWQRKLGTVDVVLNTWSDVQRKWQALESIFVGSADIRVQLPGDSARFDALNVDFKVSTWGSARQNAAYTSVH